MRSRDQLHNIKILNSRSKQTAELLQMHKDSYARATELQQALQAQQATAAAQHRDEKVRLEGRLHHAEEELRALELRLERSTEELRGEQLQSRQARKQQDGQEQSKADHDGAEDMLTAVRKELADCRAHTATQQQRIDALLRQREEEEERRQREQRQQQLLHDGRQVEDFTARSSELQLELQQMAQELQLISSQHQDAEV